jgi:molecular chaperone GrpE
VSDDHNEKHGGELSAADQPGDDSVLPENQTAFAGEGQAETTAAPAAPEDRVAELEAQAAEYLDGWQRARAELANFRKRTERDREQMASVLRGDVVKQLLPVVDDFDLAVGSLPEDLEGHDWINGVLLIHRKLQSTLAELGVSEIDALGQPFDPAYHEAVMQRESAEHEPHIVIEVMRKGYMIEDRVLRPAMVAVSS